MNKMKAAFTLRAAIVNGLAFAVLTTYPDEKQLDALNSVARDELAPADVCNKFDDLEPPTPWGEVVEVIRELVSRSDPALAERINPW